MLASFKSHLYKTERCVCVLRQLRGVLACLFLFDCCFKAGRDIFTHNTLLLAFLSLSFVLLFILLDVCGEKLMTHQAY